MKNMMTLTSWIIAPLAVASGLMCSGFLLGLFYSLVHLGWAFALQLFPQS